ncbi:hypothetical protein DFH28DRAFT_1095784 [Melampsora americana]|nr:hypothetical protein DFH28DRAFT_1095784 [Melampsora americana]
MSNTFISDTGDLSAPEKLTQSELDQVEQSKSKVTAQVTNNFSNSDINNLLGCPTILENSIRYTNKLDNFLETQEEARLAMIRVTHTPEEVEQWSQFLQAKFLKRGLPLPQSTAAQSLESARAPSFREHFDPILASDRSLPLGSACDWRTPQDASASDNWSLLNLSFQIHKGKTIGLNHHLEQVEIWKLAHALGTQSWLNFDRSNTVSPPPNSHKCFTSTASSQNPSAGSSSEEEISYNKLERDEPRDPNNPLVLNDLSQMGTKLDLAEQESMIVSDIPPSTMNKAGQMMKYDDIFDVSTKVSRRSRVPTVELEKMYGIGTVPARCNLFDFFRVQKKQGRGREREKTRLDEPPTCKRIKRV